MKKRHYISAAILFILVASFAAGCRSTVDRASSNKEGWLTRTQAEHPNAILEFDTLHIHKTDQGVRWSWLGSKVRIDEATFLDNLNRFESIGARSVFVSADEDITTSQLRHTLTLLRKHGFHEVFLLGLIEGVFSNWLLDDEELEKE